MFSNQITDTDLFYKTVAAAVAKTETSDLSDSLQKRWINAIGKAVVEIEENGEFVTFHKTENLLTVWSQKSDETYSVNGHCECKASLAGQPCWHIACKKLFVNYFEAVGDTALNGGGGVSLNVAPLPSEMDNAIYCKPQPTVEKIGGIAI